MSYGIDKMFIEYNVLTKFVQPFKREKVTDSVSFTLIILVWMIFEQGVT